MSQSNKRKQELKRASKRKAIKKAKLYREAAARKAETQVKMSGKTTVVHSVKTKNKNKIDAVGINRAAWGLDDAKK